VNLWWDPGIAGKKRRITLGVGNQTAERENGKANKNDAG
jgi:hypothetical protein